MKSCPTCGERKPVRSFYKDRRSKDGLKSQCKPCHNAGNVRTRNPDRKRVNNRLSARRRRVADPERFRTRERQASRRRPVDERVIARRLLNAAVRRGDVARPAACSRCSALVRVTGHHPDYSKPLEVLWLCYVCHAEEERHA